MGMGLSSTGGLKPEINVTPMIDVLLVLIIIFMLIQPHESGLPSEVPQQSAKMERTPPPETIVLEIAYDQQHRPVIRINSTLVPREELEARLRDIYKERAEKIIFLKGDSRLDFLDVAQVIDIARAADAGIRVGLMTRDVANAD